MNEQPRVPRPERGAQAVKSALLRTATVQVLVNGVIPVAIYLVLQAFGVPVVLALVLSGIAPAATIVASFIRSRKIDKLGLSVLLVLLIASGASLLFSDPRIVLAKESVFTGSIGLFLLGSLAARKPAMFYLWRLAASMKGAERKASWDHKWAVSAEFRRSQRLMTGGIGLLCLIEAMVRVALTAVLPTAAMLIVSQLLPFLFLALIFPWMFHAFRTSWNVSDTEPTDERKGLSR